MAALATLISILTQALTIVPAGTALFNQFTLQKAQADEWAASGHVPTDAEWAELDARVKALEQQIDDAAR